MKRNIVCLDITGDSSENSDTDYSFNDTSKNKEDIEEFSDDEEKFISSISILPIFSPSFDAIVVGIDPGVRHLGVCVAGFINRTKNIHIINHCDFDLKYYLPDKEEKSVSSYTIEEVTTGNIGIAVSRMVQSHPSIFLPKKSRVVFSVIELQMNDNPKNCCVLSSLQMIYRQNLISCVILSPHKLNSLFPFVFNGTSKNRPLRKGRISRVGWEILTDDEKVHSQRYQKKCVDPIQNPSPCDTTEDQYIKEMEAIYKGKKKPRRTKRKVTEKPTVHAMDAMFYVFALTELAEDLPREGLEERFNSLKQYKQEILDSVVFPQEQKLDSNTRKLNKLLKKKIRDEKRQKKEIEATKRKRRKQQQQQQQHPKKKKKKKESYI